MKHSGIASLLFLFLAGCSAVPADVQAVWYAQALQSKDAPASRVIVIEGRRWTVAKMGIALLDPDSRVAFVSLAMARAKTGDWPKVREIRVADGIWTVQKIGDCLLLSAHDGVKGSIREAVLTPDAYLSVDEQLIPVLAELEGILANGSPSRLPAIPVVTPK